MQFQIGDRVVDSVHGLGTIKSIQPMRLVGDKAVPYYELVTDSGTVWIPVDAPSSTRLRQVVSRASLAECRRLLLQNPVPLDRNPKLRQKEISTRLKDGAFSARCALVRDLRALSGSKPLSEGEDSLFKRISKAVYDEWAVSDGVTVQRASDEITALLDRANKAHRVTVRREVAAGRGDRA